MDTILDQFIRLTDLTLWPMLMMSCLHIVLTNSTGIMLESYALVNCRAVPSKAQPNKPTHTYTVQYKE